MEAKKMKRFAAIDRGFIPPHRRKRRRIIRIFPRQSMNLRIFPEIIIRLGTNQAVILVFYFPLILMRRRAESL